ncbi:MAG TPA: hypothetical protein VN519_06825 [Bryobacteraceae bacterium]|nr:hypothetical protein [Bryobacteraceae bacterium]
MTLITPASIITTYGDLSRLFTDLLTATDLANLHSQMVLSDLSAALALTDPSQFGAHLPYAQGLTKSVGSITAAGAPANVTFGGAGVGGGSFGAGNGLYSRVGIFSGLFSFFEGERKAILTYATLNGIPSITNLTTYAQYYNNPSNPGGSAFQVLYNPNFAALYWNAYNQGQYLDPSVVFAPAGIILGHFAITGTNAGTISNNAATNWPSANGYSAPAPTNTGGQGTTDAGTWSSLTTYTVSSGVLTPVVLYNGVYYVAVATSTNVTPGTNPSYWVVNTFGNNRYLGGMPMPQAFAPILNPACSITTTINGTCVVTVTALNQNGVSHTWTATISSATAGSIINLSPSTGGDRMNSAVTAVSIAGTATAGAFDIVTTAERAL